MNRSRYLIVLVDVCLACLALVGAYQLRFGSFSSLNSLFTGGFFRVILYLLVVVFCSYLFELYDRLKFFRRKFLLYRVFSAGLLAFFLLSATFYLFPSFQFGRGLLFISFVLFCLGQLGFRLLIRKFSNSAQFATKIFIIGVGELAKRIAEVVPKDQNVHSYVRFVSCPEKKVVVDSELIVGNINDIDELIYDYRPHKLVVALSERRGNLPLKEFMRSKLRGVDVVEATTYFEQEKGCLLVENMQPSAFIYTQGFRMTPFMRSYKRIYDIIFSVIGLVISAPLFRC